MRRKIIINNDHEHSIDIYDYFVHTDDDPKYFQYSFLEDDTWKKNYNASLYFVSKNIQTIDIIGYNNELLESFTLTKGALMSIRDQLILPSQNTFVVKIECFEIEKT